MNEAHAYLLNQGIDVWNNWRQAYPEIEPDLRNINLSGMSLTGVIFEKTDLTRANLKRANLYRANLNQVNLCNADLDLATLSRANLQRANLSGATLISGNLILADLRGANLSRARLNLAEMTGCRLRQANLHQANLAEADLSRSKLFRANLTSANFSKANLTGAHLKSVQAQAANFTGATLTGACLQGWQLDAETKLDGVICDYIYLETHQQERRPIDPTQNFAPGELKALLYPVFNAIDLLFDERVDWPALAQAFKTVRLQHHEARLSIQCLEAQISGALMMRVCFVPGADTDRIFHDFKRSYELARQQSPAAQPGPPFAPTELLNRLLLMAIGQQG